MRISSYWWNPFWQERRVVQTPLDPATCREIIRRNRRAFNRYFRSQFALGSARTWVFIDIAPGTLGSQITIRFGNHPATIASMTLFGTIYLLLWLLVVVDVVRSGDWLANLSDNAIGPFLLLVFGLLLFGPYVVLKFVARDDPRRLLRFLIETLQAQGANDHAFTEL